MIETFGILIPFLIADVLNPVLFAFMVYAAGTRRPVVTSSAMLLGHTAAYFGAGIVIALGLEKITHYLANPSSIDYLIALIVGLLLLWVAFPKAKKPETKRPEDSGSMTPPMGVMASTTGLDWLVVSAKPEKRTMPRGPITPTARTCTSVPSRAWPCTSPSGVPRDPLRFSVHSPSRSRCYRRTNQY